MSSDCTTARRADDQRRSVDDVSFCAISETGTQSAARYRGAVPMRQRRVKMMTSYLMRAQLARQANGDRQASAASNRGRTSWYLSERGPPHSSHVAVCW